MAQCRHSPAPPNKRNPGLLLRQETDGNLGREGHYWDPQGITLDTTDVILKSCVQHGLGQGTVLTEELPELQNKLFNQFHCFPGYSESPSP